MQRGGITPALVVLAIAAAVLLAGLQYFIHDAMRMQTGRMQAGATSPASSPDSHATPAAVVVITGSRGRIEAGLALMLGEGPPQRMLISGIGTGFGADDILRLAGQDEAAVRRILDCCTDLGSQAQDTKGNATEALGWARGHGFRRIFLVTSDFHMQRALLVFGRLNKGDAITITPHPVATRWLGTDSDGRSMWWRRGDAALTLAREYAKYLLAVVAG